MATVKEGDRVRVVKRELTETDRQVHAFYDHMQGLTGTVQNVYGKDEIAIKVDLPSLPGVASEVHKTATTRMRDKFSENLSEEGKRQLTKEEMEFVPHYVLLVRSDDIEKL
jgi:hypothetical protein